jgi:hypothetical protein
MSKHCIDIRHNHLLLYPYLLTIHDYLLISFDAETSVVNIRQIRIFKRGVCGLFEKKTAHTFGFRHTGKPIKVSFRLASYHGNHTTCLTLPTVCRIFFYIHGSLIISSAPVFRRFLLVLINLINYFLILRITGDVGIDRKTL